MEKLIITVCSTDGTLNTQETYPAIPSTLQEIAQTTIDAYNAGASIAHLHGPWVAPHGGHSLIPDSDAWGRMARLVREGAPDMIIQFGIAGAPLDQRIPQLQAEGLEHPDMMSVCLTCHDYNFGGREIYITHTRDELAEYCRVCADNNVKPEFEIFHVGGYWNLKFLIENADVPPAKPYWLTQFIGSTGGVWTPPTIEELDHRLRYLPEDSLWTIVPRADIKGDMTNEQYLALVTQAIALGGHVRIGVEDNPWFLPGVKAESNAQLVERVVRIAEALGRQVASPDEARQIIGLPARAPAAGVSA